jgi:hypothetical protein
VDFNRYSKFDGTDDYTHVSIDAPCVKIGNALPITIQQALDDRKIGMSVKHYDKIVFTNLTDEPVAINIGNVIVLGKDKDDIDNLFIPKNIGFNPKARVSQDQIWIRQSLINLGFLDKDHIDNMDAIVTAKKAYFRSVWVQKLEEKEFRDKWGKRILTDKELSAEMKEHAQLLQYALAGEYIKLGERAKISLEELRNVEPIWQAARYLGIFQPYNKNWSPTFLLYKDAGGKIYFFDPSRRLLKMTTDERDLAEAVLKAKNKQENIQIAGYGEINNNQGDAIAAAIELQLKAEAIDCHVFYTNLHAYSKNIEKVDILLAENAKSKLKNTLLDDIIVEGKEENTAEIDFITSDDKGAELETLIEISADKKSTIKNFFSWANTRYKSFSLGSLYASIQKYCLVNKLRSYVKSMIPYLRISKTENPDTLLTSLALQKTKYYE